MARSAGTDGATDPRRMRSVRVAAPPDLRHRRIRTSTVVVLARGLVLTTAATHAAREVNDENEDRLLRQRTLEAATVLNGSLPRIRVPLAAAAELAQGTDGDVEAAEELLLDSTGDGGPFVGAAVFELGTPDPIDAIGVELRLVEAPPEEIDAVLRAALEGDDFHVAPMLDGEVPRLGYAYASQAEGARYVAYAEAGLPPNRRQVVQQDSAFDDLDYAIYIGTDEVDEQLLIASLEDLPIEGRRASETIVFGDTELRIVMTPRGHVGADVLQWLPWLILATGLALAIGAAALTERLLRQRTHAEGLAGLLADMYASQRTIAVELQHSLLPQELPVVAGLDVGVRYEPGVEGVDIGGDWYDVVALDEHHVLVVVGDVSGRGIPAAAVMASMRYAIRAYAAQGDPPTAILRKLRELLDVTRDGHFATVLCGVIDVRTREITFANAGHPNALLVSPTGAHFVTTDVAAPIGVPSISDHDAVTIAIPDDATLLAFTDGLFERRGESIDVGLAKLREAALRHDVGLDELLGLIVADVVPDGTDDDIALLGVRWQT